MKKLVAVLLTFLLVLTGCTSVKVTKVEDDIKTDSLKFHKQYKNVQEKNNYKYITYDRVLDIIEKGSGVIYLGYPTCFNCKRITPILDEVAKEKEVKEIYYYNFKEIRENNTDEYKKLVELLKDNLEEDEEGNKMISAPTILFVQNGEIKGVEYNLLPDTDEEELTEEIKNNVKQKLSELFDKVYNDDCNC